MPWTDEQKTDLIKKYTDMNPTPENSTELVKQLAEELGQTPNGVRIILNRAGVYIKKSPEASSSKAGNGDKPARVSKADSQAELVNAISDLGQSVDLEIINKLTGKAALYLAGVFRKVAEPTATAVESE